MNSPSMVSIIMPAYNSAKYIGPAIQSVIDQTFTDWELFIVDDGSTDNTEEIVTSFLSDRRVQYVKQKNAGSSAARNHGLSLSQGKFIAFLDADDIWKPTKLEKQIEIFEKYPDVGVCGTAMELIRPSGEVFRTSDRKEFYGRAVPDLVTGKLAVAMSSSVTRKEVFDKVGNFIEDFRPIALEYDFWLRASMEFMFYNIEEKLIQYRTGHPSISQEGGDKRRDLVLNIVIPRFLKEYGGSKYVKWYHVWALSSDIYFNRACEKTKWTDRTYWMLRALCCNPFRLEHWFGLAKQFIPFRIKKK